MNEEGNKSVWFVPRSTVGGYHLAVEIVSSGEDCYVFVRSGVGMADKGDIHDLESLMTLVDIKYIIGRRPSLLPFEKAVEFMTKQTAFKRA